MVSQFDPRETGRLMPLQPALRRFFNRSGNKASTFAKRMDWRTNRECQTRICTPLKPIVIAHVRRCDGVVEDVQMTDDKYNIGYQDRAQVSGDQEYEVGYFASKFGLSIPQVRELIEKHGNDRATLEREAKQLGNR